MTATLLTYLQLFGIGLTFGIVGPCLFTCAPVLLAYIAGAGKTPREALADVALFLSGRLIAYGLLGLLAGLSGAFLRHVTGGQLVIFSRVAAALVSVALAASLLWPRAGRGPSCGPRCGAAHRGAVAASGGLFIFGLVLGLAPCAPLVALLFEIVLMSRNALEGCAYALSFGAGTFLAGLLVVGAAAGFISWLPRRLMPAGKGLLALRIFCAALLLGLGLVFLFGGGPWLP